MLIEIYPTDVLAAFLVLLAVALLPTGLTVWVMRPDRRRGCTECADTAELLRTPMRARRRSPMTGVVHESHQSAADDPTVVMLAVDGDR